MKEADRSSLEARVTAAAQAALDARGFVTSIDVLVGIGWLDPATLARWRQGQLPSLEEGIQTNPARVSAGMDLFRSWARGRALVPWETVYVAKLPGRPSLRFSRSGDDATERAYRTHWVSPDLPARKRAALEKAEAAPELVAIEPLDGDWRCHRCGGTGGMLVMEPPGPSCLACAGLGDLEFLPSGDATLSRRAKARSRRFAVVVRFSRARKRYERQGLLVEPEVLARIREEMS